MFKFLLWLLLFYLLFQLIKSIIKNKPPHKYTQNEPQVHGTPRKNDPLDLSKHDVEDATYQEIKKKKDENNS